MKIWTKFILVSLTLMSFSHKVEANNYTQNDNTRCYAQVAYHEARAQGTIAMQLVQGVTYNRVVAKGYPRSACAVVWQRGQYSWTVGKGHRLDPTAPADRAALAEAIALARSLRAGQWHPSITADHFLSPEALPGAQRGKPRFPAWARCPATGAECMSYKGLNLRSPDFTYAGIWFYTLRSLE